MDIPEAIHFLTEAGFFASYNDSKHRLIIVSGKKLTELKFIKGSIAEVERFFTIERNDEWVVDTFLGQLSVIIKRPTLAEAVDVVFNLHQPTPEFGDNSLSLEAAVERLKEVNLEPDYVKEGREHCLRICLDSENDTCVNGMSIHKLGSFYAITKFGKKQYTQVLFCVDSLSQAIDFTTNYVRDHNLG